MLFKLDKDKGVIKEEQGVYEKSTADIPIEATNGTKA